MSARAQPSIGILKVPAELATLACSHPAPVNPPNPVLPAPRRGLPEPLRWAQIDPIILGALAEDVASGDLTGEGAVPAHAQARGTLVAKQEGILAGIDVFLRTFELTDPCLARTRNLNDGDAVTPGRRVACVQGNARAILRAERVALNLLQRMSGTASLAARFCQRVAHLPNVRILDTRKTTPGLRVLEKYAVRCGGAENHRIGLYDEAMLKDNHIELAGSSIEEALGRLRAFVGPGVRITAEARDGEEAFAAIRGGADVVMLDNFSPAGLREWCPKLRRYAQELERIIELEASGGIRLETVRAFGETGVDRISVGALTHSAEALDFSLELEPIQELEPQS